jgi:hypothetical protein
LRAHCCRQQGSHQTNHQNHQNREPYHRSCHLLPACFSQTRCFFAGSWLIKKEEWSAVPLLSHLCHFPSPPTLEQNRPFFLSFATKKNTHFVFTRNAIPVPETSNEKAVALIL